MRIGVPKEMKDQEYRVGMTPGSVRELCTRGHTVLVETNAGKEIGFTDEAYRLSGAEIVTTSKALFASAEMIVKVKEPQPEECRQLRVGQLLVAYLHLAADPKQADLLLASNCIAIAYETVTDNQGGLPLLTPMSEVAGRLSIQAGAHCLEKPLGGRGVLLGGIPGVSPAKVVILGAGAAGTQALHVAIGMGANVFAFDNSLKRLSEIDELFQNKITTAYANASTIEESLHAADLVVGAVLVPGASTPKLINREMLRKMRAGAVIVDISIDQGGCFETSRPTTHTQPTYIEENIVHYCVTNMPGAVPLTSTVALNNATLPFIIALADLGLRKALLDPHLLQGLNICRGKITHQAVAVALHKPFVSPITALGELT